MLVRWDGPGWRLPAACPRHPLHSVPCHMCLPDAHGRTLPQRGDALPLDGPDVGPDVPGGGAI